MADADEALDVEIDGEQSGDAPRKSSKALIIGILGIGVGVAGGWLLHSTPSNAANAAATDGAGGAPADDEAGAEKAAAHGPIVELETFIVNLRGGEDEVIHYLKCGFAVQLADESLQEMFAAQTIRIRDAILLCLSNLGLADTDGTDNKQKLRAAVLARINDILGAGAATDLYLTEFVVQ